MNDKFVESMVEQGMDKDDALLYVTITMNDEFTPEMKDSRLMPIIDRWLKQHTNNG